MAPRMPKSPSPKLVASNPNPPPREAMMGDNLHGEESERVQLISFISKISGADAEVEQAKAPFDAAKKSRNQLYALAKSAGFSRKEIERRIEEMNVPTREFAEGAAREHKHRRWLGILDADQSKLMLGDTAPAEVKDEAHWKGEGYKAGLRQMEARPPKECPERFVQAWLGEHARGLKEVLEANAPRKMGVREQAAADFKEEHPNYLEPGSPEAKTAERKAIATARESLNAMKAPEGVDEPFEATQEELAAQNARKAIQESRAVDDEAVV